MLGQTISRYKILEKIGSGGIGVVYKAEDTKLGRIVALKFLKADALDDEDAKRRFIREARAAAALDHSNVCAMHDIDEAEGQTFLAMSFVEGERIRQKIAQRPLPLHEALDYAIQAGQGLQAAHKKGVVHRDIKSANLMVNEEGQVKIMDFGLAQLADQSRITKTATFLGTPAYMSHQQAKREPPDERSDIWSLGAVIYEMVSGRLPFEGENEHGVLYGIVNSEPEPLTSLRVGLPVELDRIVSKAMAKRPEERYQHVEDILVDLRALLWKPAGQTTKKALESGRRSLWPVVAALLPAMAIGLWWWSRPGEATFDPDAYALRRLTSDGGLAYQPALSRDGKWVVYASDRSGDDNLDIWVQQTAGGEPIQLTSDTADEFEPSFSPDGSQVVFRSNREGGGTYVVPSLGGEPRLLAPKGYRPRFSPDGTRVAYWYGGEHMPVVKDASVSVLASAGGNPEELGMGRSPIWSPDGRALLYSRGSGSPFVSDWVAIWCRFGVDIQWVERIQRFAGETVENRPNQLKTEDYGVSHL